MRVGKFTSAGAEVSQHCLSADEIETSRVVRLGPPLGRVATRHLAVSFGNPAE